MLSSQFNSACRHHSKNRNDRSCLFLYVDKADDHFFFIWFIYILVYLPQTLLFVNPFFENKLILFIFVKQISINKEMAQVVNDSTKADNENR